MEYSTFQQGVTELGWFGLGQMYNGMDRMIDLAVEA